MSQNPPASLFTFTEHVHISPVASHAVLCTILQPTLKRKVPLINFTTAIQKPKNEGRFDKTWGCFSGQKSGEFGGAGQVHFV